RRRIAGRPEKALQRGRPSESSSRHVINPVPPAPGRRARTGSGAYTKREGVFSRASSALGSSRVGKFSRATAQPLPFPSPRVENQDTSGQIFNYASEWWQHF